MIMTQCLAFELAPKIRVNTVIPGLTVTVTVTVTVTDETTDGDSISVIRRPGSRGKRLSRCVAWATPKTSRTRSCSCSPAKLVSSRARD